MKEELITFETANLAKDKGFDMPWSVDNSRGVFDAYREDGKLGSCVLSDGIYDIQAPTQALLQKWLREEHMIRIFVGQGAAGNFIFNIYTYPIPNNIGKWERSNNIQSYTTYEEALEEGLQEALKLI